MRTLFLILFFPIWTGFESRPVVVKESLDLKEMMILNLAHSNGFTISKRILNAIKNASDQYNIPAIELTAIAIIETSLGNNLKRSTNKNGTIDRGLFQINSVNRQFCIEYNLDSNEGSALCAAKLLDNLRQTRTDYIGAYHSKTPSKKSIYLKKIAKVFKNYSDKYIVTKTD